MILGPCIVCGITRYNLSVGSPHICPICDSGSNSQSIIQRQKEEIEQLRSRNLDLLRKYSKYVDKEMFSHLTNPTPCYDLIRQDVKPMGLYRGYQTRYVIDAPIDVFLQDVVGLNVKDSDPIYLKFDLATQTIIDGKLYTVLIKERYVEYPEDNKEG